MAQEGCKANTVRGGGCYFGPNVTEQLLQKYNLQFLIRSHECKPEGYEFCHRRKVGTVSVVPGSGPPSPPGRDKRRLLVAHSQPWLVCVTHSLQVARSFSLTFIASLNLRICCHHTACTPREQKGRYCPISRTEIHGLVFSQPHLHSLSHIACCHMFQTTLQGDRISALCPRQGFRIVCHLRNMFNILTDLWAS